eukprot:6387271-Prymnesium_polylepis.1
MGSSGCPCSIGHVRLTLRSREHAAECSPDRGEGGPPLRLLLLPLNTRAIPRGCDGRTGEGQPLRHRLLACDRGDGSDGAARAKSHRQQVGTARGRRWCAAARGEQVPRCTDHYQITLLLLRRRRRRKIGARPEAQQQLEEPKWRAVLDGASDLCLNLRCVLHTLTDVHDCGHARSGVSICICGRAANCDHALGEQHAT